MADQKEAPRLSGIEIAEWAAAHAPTVREFPASRFVVIQDGDLVRFVFGHHGAPVDSEGKRGTPVFSVAVSMSPFLASQLRDVLNKIVQANVIEGADNVPR